jgi:hypothetical protein
MVAAGRQEQQFENTSLKHVGQLNRGVQVGAMPPGLTPAKRTKSNEFTSGRPFSHAKRSIPLWNNIRTYPQIHTFQMHTY